MAAERLKLSKYRMKRSSNCGGSRTGAVMRSMNSPDYWQIRDARVEETEKVAEERRAGMEELSAAIQERESVAAQRLDALNEAARIVAARDKSLLSWIAKRRNVWRLCRSWIRL